MNKDKIEEMFRHGKYEKLIEELMSQGEDSLDEFSMLRLAQTYLMVNDETNALKFVSMVQKKFAGDAHYADEEGRLMQAVIKGEKEEYINTLMQGATKDNDENDNLTEDVDKYFAGVVGMKAAKKSLQAISDSYNVQQERIEEGVEAPIVWMPHIAVAGERGSGKTMLARIITRFLNEKGLCGQHEPLAVMAETLKTRSDVRQLTDKSNMVIVVENMEDFISNNQIDHKDILNALMENLREYDEKRVTYIFTGSHEAMEKMKTINKDIEDYFFDFIELQSYSADELVKIMRKIAQEEGFYIHKSCIPALEQKIDTDCRISEFMNTVYLKRLIRNASRNMVERYKANQDELDSIDGDRKLKALTTLMPEDFVFNSSEKSVDDLCAELYAMTGLQRVKEEVKKQINTVRMGIQAKKAGASRNNEHGTLHMVFAGEPGTGKTTVAEIIGKIYFALGILPKGNQKIYTVSRADLIAKYEGQTASSVKETCQRADGGVLFIDEAYSLVNSEWDDYGREAVDTLIQEMENRRGSMMVILAGYEKPMDDFLNANPGFKSRIPNVVHFDSYTIDEMTDIFEQMVKKENYYFESWDVINAARSLIESKSKDPDFGNARGIRNLFEKVKYVQDERLVKESNEGKCLLKDDYDAITLQDIQETGNALDKGTRNLDELFEELRGLTGLNGVKKQVEAMVASVRYEKLMKSRGIVNGSSQGTRHLIFSGNPGTGKSTVASLLGQIYVKLGVLKKNTFVLAKRTELIGEYQGQTAPKVANKVAEADGGILFIDEAYQLCIDKNDSYGMEAIGTLLSLAEEKRDTLMIILAGYSKDMDEFMSVNPGLRSRFPKVVSFEDYNTDELISIFTNMCAKESMKIDNGVMEAVREELEKRKEADSKEFANARGVRNLLEQIISRQNSRIIQEMDNGIEHSDEELRTMKKEDVCFG